ncbi:thrombospondin, partial [Micromonospora sp. NPDC000207]
GEHPPPAGVAAGARRAAAGRDRAAARRPLPPPPPGVADGDRSSIPTSVADDDPTLTDATPVTDRPPVTAGPKPRASLLATTGLVFGVAGALVVLTGTLAGYGIAVGAVGAVLSVLGLIATRRRHVVGKPDALLGIAFGLGAVVVGVLAMTGLYVWPNTDGDWVQRLREWLDSQFLNRF